MRVNIDIKENYFSASECMSVELQLDFESFLLLDDGKGKIDTSITKKKISIEIARKNHVFLINHNVLCRDVM